MLRTYISECFDLSEQADLYEWSEAQVQKLALANVLDKMAHFIRKEAFDGETDMPRAIRVAIIKQGWDLQVELWPEKRV